MNLSINQKTALISITSSVGSALSFSLCKKTEKIIAAIAFTAISFFLGTLAIGSLLTNLFVKLGGQQKNSLSEDYQKNLKSWIHLTLPFIPVGVAFFYLNIFNDGLNKGLKEAIKQGSNSIFKGLIRGVIA